MRPSLSIISCVSGRLGLFVKHLDALATQDAAADCEYIVGTWEEDAGHREALKARKNRFAAACVVSVATDRWWPLPLAYNAALGQATSERLLIVGSDIVVCEGLLRWAMERPEGDIAWCFRVVREDGMEIVGPKRRIAIPFCMTLPARPVREMGGWDTAFCDGPCYDDNDFAARLLLAGAVYRWCDRFTNVHLSHPRFGGKERRARSRRNEAIWRKRIAERSGSLWPIQGDGQPPEGVEGDGIEYQMSLRQMLIEWSYPGKASG